MSDRLLKESDVMRIAFQLPYVVNSAFTDAVKALPSADRPQGEWIGYEIPSECSVCGHHWDEYVFGQDIWHDGSVPNYCPHCGARMKGADDYERAIEQAEHDMLYEPTYNSEDGSM